MKKAIVLLLVGLSVASCTQTEKGASIGAVSGAVIGGAVTGNVRGAAVGAAIGGVGGALIGNASEPGYCYYRDQYGRQYDSQYGQYGTQSGYGYQGDDRGYYDQSYGQGYGQQGYGQPYGYGMTAEHPQTQTVFLLGIIGIFVGIVPFIAWYMGGQAKKEIDAGAPYQWDGSKLKTGYMLGKVFSIIYIVFMALYILFIFFAIIFGLSS